MRKHARTISRVWQQTNGKGGRQPVMNKRRGDGTLWEVGRWAKKVEYCTAQFRGTRIYWVYGIRASLRSFVCFRWRNWRLITKGVMNNFVSSSVEKKQHETKGAHKVGSIHIVLICCRVQMGYAPSYEMILDERVHTLRYMGCQIACERLRILHGSSSSDSDYVPDNLDYSDIATWGGI